MFQSAHSSQLAVRIGLAFAFLWFGLDKFTHPQAWIHVWLSLPVGDFFTRLHIGASDVANIVGLAEVLVGLSLATGFFARMFASVGIGILLVSILLHGMAAPLSYHVALMGGLVAVIIWPERTYH